MALRRRRGRRAAQLVGSRDVICTRRDVDNYGRIVAVCRSGTTDLARRDGARRASPSRIAVTATTTSTRSAKRAPRAAASGPASSRRPRSGARDDERTPRRPPARCGTAPHAATARDGCYIKGNINGEGERIYHVPGSPSYDDTVIDESRGERWFCTEAEARAAGWRAPRG